MVKVKLAFQPYPLQQEIIDYIDGKRLNIKGKRFRFFVAAMGRQVGKSILAKNLAIEHGNNRNEEVMWVAPSIPTARKHWNDLVKMIEKSGMPVKKINQSFKEIVFMGGGTISIRSALEPDNLRGGTLGLLILDEAAFFRNGSYVWNSVLLPQITASGGVALLLSTPNGWDYFYDLFKKGQDPQNLFWKSWQAPSYISPYQDKELLDDLRTTMPEYQFKEEFLAEFLADSSGVFSGGEKAAVVDPIDTPLSDRVYVAGIDFGFNHDASIFTIVDKYTREQVYGNRFFNYGTISTVKKLVKLLRHWQPEITYAEKNGMGDTYFNLLKSALSGMDIDNLEPDEPSNDLEASETDSEFKADWGGRLKALHIDNRVKRKLVETLAADIEYGRLKILKPVPGSYGEIQLSEMSTYKRERTKSQLDVTYNAAEGCFDDTVSGLYLANKGVPRPPKPDYGNKEKSKKSPFRGSGRLRAHRKGRR